VFVKIKKAMKKEIAEGKTVVVFGATGTVGSPLVRYLLEQKCRVRAVLSNPRRKLPKSWLDYGDLLATVAVDLNCKKSIAAVCRASDAVFLLTATDPRQVDYEIAVISVCEELNIGTLVKLSAPDIPSTIHVEVSDWHRMIEKRLETSPLNYVLLQPCSFMQNWSRTAFPIKFFGKFSGIMEQAARCYVDARDVAEIAAKYLLDPSPHNGLVVPIRGPKAYTHYEVAALLSEVTGRKVQYENLTRAVFLKRLTKQVGLPDWLARHLAEIEVLAIKNPEKGDNSVTEILNRKPRIMEAYLQEERRLFMPPWKR
jgi:uncharacterized protein YbjT (DUF2867 family)